MASPQWAKTCPHIPWEGGLLGPVAQDHRNPPSRPQLPSWHLYSYRSIPPVLQKGSKSLVFLKFPYFLSRTQREDQPPIPQMACSGHSSRFRPQAAWGSPEKSYIKNRYHRLAWHLCGRGWVCGHDSQASSQVHWCQGLDEGLWLRSRMWSRSRSVALSNGGSSSCSAGAK